MERQLKFINVKTPTVSDLPGELRGFSTPPPNSESLNIVISNDYFSFTYQTTLFTDIKNHCKQILK